MDQTKCISTSLRRLQLHNRRWARILNPPSLFPYPSSLQHPTESWLELNANACRHLIAQVQRCSKAEGEYKLPEIENNDIDPQDLRCRRCPKKLFQTEKKLKIHWLGITPPPMFRASVVESW